MLSAVKIQFVLYYAVNGLAYCSKSKMINLCFINELHHSRWKKSVYECNGRLLGPYLNWSVLSRSVCVCSKDDLFPVAVENDAS